MWFLVYVVDQLRRVHRFATRWQHFLAFPRVVTIGIDWCFKMLQIELRYPINLTEKLSKDLGTYNNVKRLFKILG